MNFGYTAEECLVTAGWLAATLFGLLALWATTGRFRWYWHAAPLALALAALVPMGGYQPTLIFGSQAAGVVLYGLVGAFIARRRTTGSAERQKRPWRFTLFDGVLAMLLVAAVLAIARNVPYAGDAVITLDWWRYVATGLGFAAATCAAFQLVAGRTRWYIRLVVTAVLLGAGMLLLFAGDISEPFLPYLIASATVNTFGSSTYGDSFEWVVGLAIAQFWTTSSWLLFLRLAGWHWWPSQSWEDRWALLRADRWPRTHRVVHVVTCLALGFATLVLLGTVAEIYWNLLPPRHLPTVVLPNPNGVDDLDPVAKLINWSAIPMQDPDEVDDLACGQFTEQNAEPLRRIRESLDKLWMRKLDFHDSDTMFPDIESLRAWARVLDADARYQLAQGRVDLAARDYVDVVRFGNLSGLGGAALDATIADALRSIGIARIAEHLDQFDEPALREIACSLDLFAGDAEPLELVSERDSLIQRYTTGWIGRLTYWAEHEALPQQPSTEETVAIVRNRTDAMQRLLMLEAAIRAYRARHDQIPPSLGELVPEYLSAIPPDPFSGGPFKYRPTADGYLLYSVGGNGIDDGGQRASLVEAVHAKSGDLFFDASTVLP